MSYAEMDHAGWVESNIEAYKRRATKPKRDKYGVQLGWQVAPDKLSDFQAQVFEILGIVGGGIYNAPISWDTVDWGHRGSWEHVSVTWGSGNGLATFDSNRLTLLVLCCHTARIRCDISPNGPRAFRFSFWPREATGNYARRHPNVAEAVADFEAYLPADHRLRQPRPPPDKAEAA